MPTAIVTLPDGRRAKLSGPTREAIQAEVEKLARAAPQKVLSNPTNDPDLAIIDAMIRGDTSGTRPFEDAPAVVSLPLGFDFSIGGPVGRVLHAVNASSFQRKAEPFVGATLGALAAGPIGARLGASLPGASGLVGRAAVSAARAGLRAAAPVTGAGAGGAAGGAAAEIDSPGATPESIANAAISAGANMAAAEALGGGLVKVGSAVLAPARAMPVLKYVDLPKPLRDAVSAFVKDLPRRARDAVGAAEKASPGFGKLTNSAAQGVREFADRVSTGGTFSIRKAREEWKRLPEEVQQAIGGFKKFARGASRISKLAKTEVGQEVLERTAIPLASALFGPGVGAVLWGAKQLVHPGILARYLSRTDLPGSAVTQAVAGQAARVFPRGIASNEEPE